ncbi:NAD-dependent epimerase/dehydratase family protein [Patescibacteria group bacterium]|nr:NAD-dependent epimerase/dehydratase family protein [Patescibacteria group bacterium]
MPKKQIITKSALVPTVLISGGAGFIGSHLAEYLLQNKARVVVLDNFKTGKEIHVKHLLQNENFALYDVDINESVPPEIQSVDYVFHLAGLEEYFYSKDYLSLDSLFTNSLGTKNLLDLAKKSSAKFLLASTIDVYQGKMSQLDIDKYFGSSSGEENKFSLIEAKRFAEAVVWEYYKKHDMDARIVRLPEVYGPRMDLSSSGFLGGFIKNVINGSSLEIFGDGDEKEYYLYISDVISGIIKSQFEENTKGKIYSLIPDSSVSALESAYLVRSVADANLSVQFKNRLTDFKGDLSIPDTLNVKDISWKPKVSLKEGVMRTLESFDYSPNTHAFKPAKLVEQKIKSKEILPDTISSLQGVKITTRPKDSVPDEIFSEERGMVRTEVKRKPFFKMSLKKEKKEKKKEFKKEITTFKYRVKADMGYGLAILAIFLSAIAVFVGIPSASAYFNIKKGVTSLENAKTSLFQMDSVRLERDTLSAYNSFRSGRSSLRKLRWAFNLFGIGDNFNSYDKLLSSLIFFSKAGNTGSAAIKPLESVLDTIRPDNNLTLEETLFDDAKQSIVNTRDYLRMAEADVLGVEITAVPEKYRNNLNEFRDFLLSSQDIVDSLSTVMSGLPQALGVGGEKKYIVWFQNSNEIRPTGGFIGSYAIIRIESGKIKDLTIDDIYNPDGQIDVRNIKTEPPEPIKEFLDEDTLYLRNSNWDPDFTKSAKTFDDIYFKITGETIDGYVALDLDFVEGLLRVTGPIFLASYNEDISADNLDERAQYYSGFDYREGSTDKKSFLTILGGKLLERLFSLGKEETPLLVEELGKSLNQRHMQIYFSNNSINSLLKEKKWDGGLVNTDGDYLFVVNSNLGGTKSNYYVENNMSYVLSSMTRDGLLRADLYLDYRNNAEDDAWPGGPYTNYVRVLTQDGSKLTGAKIIFENGTEQDIFEDVIVTKVGRYTSFEKDFKLDPKSSIRLVLSYDLSVNISLTKEDSYYSLVWQKQPGTSGDNYSFVFNPPFGSVVGLKSQNLEYIEGAFKNSGILEKDLMYYVNLK